MLKKIVALFIFLIAICTMLGLSEANNKKVLQGVGENHRIYMGNSSAQIHNSPLVFKSKIKAETCTLDAKNFNLNDILKQFDAEIIEIEVFDGGISYYAKSKKIKHVEIINGKRVNLHIAIRGKNIKLGVPIIYDSF